MKMENPKQIELVDRVINSNGELTLALLLVKQHRWKGNLSQVLTGILNSMTSNLHLMQFIGEELRKKGER